MSDRSEYFKEYRRRNRAAMNENSRRYMAKRRGTSVEDIEERRFFRKKFGEHYAVFIGLIPFAKRYSKKWSGEYAKQN